MGTGNALSTLNIINPNLNSIFLHSIAKTIWIVANELMNSFLSGSYRNRRISEHFFDVFWFVEPNRHPQSRKQSYFISTLHASRFELFLTTFWQISKSFFFLSTASKDSLENHFPTLAFLWACSESSVGYSWVIQYDWPVSTWDNDYEALDKE